MECIELKGRPKNIANHCNKFDNEEQAVIFSIEWLKITDQLKGIKREAREYDEIYEQCI